VSEFESKVRGVFGRLFRGEEPKPAPAEQTREPEEPEQVESPAGLAPPPSPPAAPAPPPASVSPAPAPVSAPPTAALPADPVQPKRNWFERLRSGLSKTSTKLTDGITSVFTKRKLDAAMLEELEDLLIQADLGLDTAARVSEALAAGRFNKDISPEEVKAVLAEEVEKILQPVAKPLAIDSSHLPHVILVVGVNGTGKTTTIGKLARNFVSEGKRVMLAAGDTFRAAAIEQLKIWGERTGSVVVAADIGADAAGVAYDALRQAREEKRQVLIIDTAGRLQNKANLMAELEKIVRVIKKFDPSAPHTVLLTLDATTGQNALNQVEIFRQTAGVTGLIMTKLDGTARGGILVAIAAKYGLPVHAIGVGESAEDLQPFDARDFARAIAGL
jgi:fused signal recognition particle receptor